MSRRHHLFTTPLKTFMAPLKHYYGEEIRRWQLHYELSELLVMHTWKFKQEKLRRMALGLTVSIQ
jgi:hypothetical protein